jgi:ABC-2 type transport system ATP-binding protein
VDRITFNVREGEIFGFLGPNGAGKTTTIKILTGQLRPSSGKARVAGCDVVHDREVLKPRVGVVFEHQNIYENLSARDNLKFIGQLYGVNRKAVEWALDLVGLLDRANEKTRSFSNGMKQRLLSARAILHQPQILFLDEPTRGLDPNIAREIREFILGLSREGITIFLTTHYMEEADRLCGRVAILEHGRIAALGAPSRLKELHGTAPETTLEDVFVNLTGRSMTRNE